MKGRKSGAWSGSPKHSATVGAGPGPGGAARTMAASSGRFARKVKPESNATRMSASGKGMKMPTYTQE